RRAALLPARGNHAGAGPAQSRAGHRRPRAPAQCHRDGGGRSRLPRQGCRHTRGGFRAHDAAPGRVAGAPGPLGPRAALPLRDVRAPLRRPGMTGEPQPKARRADMVELSERSEEGEPQPKARRADMVEPSERSEEGEPQPKARRADILKRYSSAPRAAWARRWPGAWPSGPTRCISWAATRRGWPSSRATWRRAGPVLRCGRARWIWASPADSRGRSTPPTARWIASIRW